MSRSCRPGVLAILLLPLVLAGCSTRPYETRSPGVALPRLSEEAAALLPVGRYDYDPRPRAVSICYNSLYNEPLEVMERVQELCPGDGELERVKEEFFWTECSFLLPTRATFVCVPGPPPPQKYR